MYNKCKEYLAQQGERIPKGTNGKYADQDNLSTVQPQTTTPIKFLNSKKVTAIWQ